MEETSFTAVTWNNGEKHKSGAGFGIKISALNRDIFFNRKWETVFLDLEGGSSSIEVNVDKESFWNPDCGELINKEIGLWFMENKIENWQRGKPYGLKLTVTGVASFAVSIDNSLYSK